MKFPVPRNELPNIIVSDRERVECKNKMQNILQDSLKEYEFYVEHTNRVLDFRNFYHCSEKEKLKVYKKRSHCDDYWLIPQSNSLSAPTDSNIRGSTHGRGSIVAPNTFQPSTVMTSSSPPFPGAAPMLLVGDMAGQVENVLFGAVTTTNDELSLANSFLHENAGDCQVLNVLEAPSNLRPYHSLVYKWYANKSTTPLVKSRDMTFVEYTGLTTSYTGETLGFFIAHSIDLPEFPPMKSAIRATQSVRFLIRQKSENIVELFMLGCVDPGGKISKAASSFLSVDTLLSFTKLVDLAEAKRLTKMVLQYQETSFQLAPPTQARSKRTSECTLCHQRMEFYSTHSVADCSACGQLVCSRCRVVKKFYARGNASIGLGKFQKINCCKPCLLIANAVLKQPPQPNLTPTLDSPDEQPRPRKPVLKEIKLKPPQPVAQPMATDRLGGPGVPVVGQNYNYGVSYSGPTPGADMIRLDAETEHINYTQGYRNNFSRIPRQASVPSEAATGSESSYSSFSQDEGSSPIQWSDPVVSMPSQGYARSTHNNTYYEPPPAMSSGPEIDLVRKMHLLEKMSRQTYEQAHKTTQQILNQDQFSNPNSSRIEIIGESPRENINYRGRM